MTKSELESRLEELEQELTDEIEMRKDVESDLKELEGVTDERGELLIKIEELEDEIVEVKTDDESVKFYKIIYEGG